MNNNNKKASSKATNNPPLPRDNEHKRNKTSEDKTGGHNPNEKLLDIYAGPAEWTRNEAWEYTEEELEELRYEQRLFDAEGTDTAYENGISEVCLPAPKGGWPLDTPKENLMQ